MHKFLQGILFELSKSASVRRIIVGNSKFMDPQSKLRHVASGIMSTILSRGTQATKSVIATK